MSMSFDTIVIGGGLAGITTLYSLAKRGRKVLLVERSDEIATGASYANGGMLTSSMADPWNGPGVARHLAASLFGLNAAMKLHWHVIPSHLSWGIEFLRKSTKAEFRGNMLANFSLAQFSVQKTEALADDIGCSSVIQRKGALKLFSDRTYLSVQRDNALSLSDVGLQFQELNPEQVLDIEPSVEAVSAGLAGALYFPDDRAGDARIFCLKLALAAQKVGGEIRTNIAVGSLIIDKNRVVGVETSKGKMFAKNIIVCAGVDSAILTRNCPFSLPIKPAKGYSLTLDMQRWNSRPTVPIVDDENHLAITPLGDTLRIVGIAEFVGNDLSIEQARIDYLLKLFGRIYPDLAAQTDIRSVLPWAGLRPMSADGKPFIGRTSVDGLWLNTGHGHLGWTMAVGSALLLDAMVAGNDPPIDPTSFSPMRGRL